MRIHYIFAVMMFIFSWQVSFADNWNVGSGGKPSRNGQSTESGPSAADVLWQGGVSSVIAQQAVTDGNIVFTSRITNINDVLHGTQIVAQDLTTGATLWTGEVPVDFPSTDWRSRVSAARNGLVFVTRSGNTNYSYMYAFSATDGSQVWKSEGLVNESTTESTAFASNGDLVAGNFESIIRINAVTGSTVWETDRVCPTSNGQEIAIWGDRGYYWEATPYGPCISVIDIETGNYLFSSEALSSGLIQQLAPFAGPDGTIYAPRSMNNVSTDYLFALKDNGTSLTTQWSTPLGFVPFGTFGIGPDGSIYSYSAAGEVMRLDPLDGSIINTSEVIFFEAVNQPRMAIDANGIVFVTNGNFGNGRLYSFNPDLSLRWSENISNVNLGGPAIGQNGTMVVCGVGTNVKAYEGSTVLLAGFYADDTEVCTGQAVSFFNQSSGNATSFNWYFEGGNPEYSNLENPVVTYDIPGSYDVTLEVGDGTNTSTINETDYILVYSCTGQEEEGKDNSIVIYPNPAENQFNIKFLESLEFDQADLIISDMVGRIIYCETINPNQYRNSISVAAWEKGVYLIRIISPDKIIFRTKLIIR